MFDIRVHNEETNIVDVKAAGFMLVYTDEDGNFHHHTQGELPRPDFSMLQMAAMQFLMKKAGGHKPK